MKVMTGLKRLAVAALGIIGAVGLLSVVHSAELNEQKILASETGLAVSKTYSMDTQAGQNVSMQTVASSMSPTNQTFTDGTVSTGSLTVNSYVALTSATATAFVTITSNTALANQTLFIAGNNIPIRVDLSFSTNTACNIAQDITANTVFLSSCASSGATGVIYTTAPTFGASYNSFSIQSSSLTAISSAAFSGGQDNQFFTLNGTIFKAFASTFTANGFFVGVSSVVTANSIAAAITNSSTTTGIIASTAVAPSAWGIVYTTSTRAGVSTKYAMFTSSSAALTLSGPSSVFVTSATSAMTGGTNPAFSVGSASITIAAHGLTTGLAVLYTTTTLTTAINPLIWGTTYYAINVDANDIALSLTSTGAVAGTAVILTSSATPLTTHTYALNPLAITGTPSFKWEISNDQTNWIPLTANVYNVVVPSVTMSAYTSTGTVTGWDIGPLDWNWLRLDVTGPTTGGIALKAFVASNP